MNKSLILLKEIGKEVLYSVIITDIIMTIYVLWLIIANTAHWLPGVLLGYTPTGTLILLKANRLFHLCYIHRRMLIHSFIVYLCCIFQTLFGFGNLLYPIRWLMFICGVYLIIELILKK